jgi:ribosomal protein L11 methyltransferase
LSSAEPRWHSVRVWPDATTRDAVTQVLFDHGSLGVQDDGPSVVTCFPVDHDVAALRAALVAIAPDARIEVAPVPEVDWSERWKDQARLHHVGPITVGPPWLAPKAPPDLFIVIEPAMAFGTGDHPTTRGMLLLMQSVIRQGDLVADLGAGSAVLSIAAAKLGASRVAAIEIDADAIGNAEANVLRNGVTQTVQVIHGDAQVLLPLLAPVRVILANIISTVLVELLPVMDAALTLDGALIVSGVLRAERANMLPVLGGAGWSLADEVSEAEWWSAAFQRAP